jgi:hypothetical protein
MRRGSTALRRRRQSMSHALHAAFEVMVALSSLAVLIWPRILADEVDLDARDSDESRIL